METGLRLMALIVDLALALATGHVIFMGLGWVATAMGVAGAALLPVMFAAFLLWPVLFMGIPTGLWGRTPGKWILGLRVVHAHGHPPSVRRALAREALKMLALAPPHEDAEGVPEGDAGFPVGPVGDRNGGFHHREHGGHGARHATGWRNTLLVHLPFRRSP